MRSPVEALIAGSTENNALLLVETWKATVCPASFAGPGEMLVAKPGTVCAPAVLSTVWFGLAGSVKLGASLTGCTLSVNVCVPLVSTPPFAVPPSSVR